MGIRKIDVTENGQTTELFIPETGDKSYDDYIEEAETEKTRDELKHRLPREKPKYSKEEIGQALRDLSDFRRRKKESPNKKYY